MAGLAEQVVYKVADGCEIRADIYQPQRARGRAVLWLHGGALIFGGREGIQPYQLERYLSAGYTVVAADYRLAPETKLPAILEDLSDVLQWLRREGPARYGVDPERVAVAGHSAGGYLALCAGQRLRPRPKAAVSFYGYGDIAGPWYTSPSEAYRDLGLVERAAALRLVGRRPISSDPDEQRFPFYVYCRQQGLWPHYATGHDPVEEPGWFTPFCPVRHVGPDDPPTLLVHGTADTDVPHEESVAMARELARHGVPHRLLSLPDLGHVLDTEDGAEDDPLVARVFDAVIEFLDQNCG